MNFKHTGLFPEQAANWDFAQEQIRNAGRPDQGAEPVRLHRRGHGGLRRGGGQRVPCGRGQGHGGHGPGRTPSLSGLEDAPIRWIVDDCAKFVEREIRRGRTL